MPPAPTTSVHCESCGGNLVEITISLDPTDLMVMRSCSTCDTRTWHRGAEATDLGGVLDLIAVDGVPSSRRRADTRGRHPRVDA